MLVNSCRNTDGLMVGHDPAKEFTHHWWDAAFNRAASSITVETKDGGVTVKTKDKKKHKKERQDAAKKTLYSNFVKTSLLANGAEEAVAKELGNASDNSDDETQSNSRPQTLCLPEDELFKLCGGRTAHKAARHGLKLNGKLARIEEQERLLMEKYQQAKSSSSQNTPSKGKELQREQDAVSKGQSNSDENVAQTDSIISDNAAETERKRKKDRKKEKKRKREMDAIISHSETEADMKKRKSVSERSRTKDDVSVDEGTADATSKTKRKKKKSKKGRS